RFSDAGFKHYEATELGYKHNMTDVQASLGIHQLPRLDGWIEYRARLWDNYDAQLRPLPLELPPPPDARMRHSRHLYQVQVGADSPLTRDELLSSLHDQRVGAGVPYRAVHLHP